MDYRLLGRDSMKRKVFVTGATSGIGKAIAETFASNGDDLLLCARRESLLATLKEELEAKYGVKVAVFTLDVRDRAAVEAKVGKEIEAFGGIDILVNNAGLAQGLEPFQESALDDAVTMVDTNVKGLIYVSRMVLPLMVKQNKGHIFNIGSTAGIYAYPNGAVYCATKSAVKTLSDGMRMDTIATDIKVTNIQPGLVETNFSEVRFHGDKERAKKVYADIEPLLAEDIASAVLFAANTPRRMQVSDMTIMANQQAAGWMKASKK